VRASEPAPADRRRASLRSIDADCVCLQSLSKSDHYARVPLNLRDVHLLRRDDMEPARFLECTVFRVGPSLLKRKSLN
jgi:hypothetical protein